MKEDDRFKHVVSDPRFKNMRQKRKKVQIDERFASMFTDKKFTLKYTKDKRGRAIEKSGSEDLKKYYQLEGKEQEKEDPSESSPSTFESSSEDKRDRTKLEKSSNQHQKQYYQPEGSHQEKEDLSELSSSSDESSSEDEEEETKDELKYNWDALDEDAPTTEDVTKRIAICNFDWDYLNATDVFVLINSFKQPKSVKIYLSEFGKQRLEEEEKKGPKELIEMPTINEEDEEDKELDDLKSKLQHVQGINHYDGDEMTEQNREIAERIRAYQINRLKYYYAVIEMDCAESANFIYNQLDGMEYEGSSSALDLRFIPDDMEFEDNSLKSECESMPDLASYEAPVFINTALQQTKVSLTWDDTDPRRKGKLRKSYTMQELEKGDLEAYLASDTDSDDNEERERELIENMSDEEGNNTGENDKMNKYRRLLQIIEEEQAEKEKVDLEVEWNAELDADEQDEDPIESDDEKKKKKRKKKEKNYKKKNQESEKDPQLDLVLLENDPKDKGDDFKFNPEDERFAAVYDSHLFNIDPSDRRFKKTNAYDELAKRKRQKRDKH